MRFTALMLLILLAPLKASAWQLLQLDSVTADYNHYLQPTFNPYFDGQEKDGLALAVNSTVAKYFFWNSQVHGESNSAKYEHIGLYMEAGVRLSRYADVSVWHHSQHTLDEGDAWGRHFQVEDAVKLRVYFFRNDTPSTVIP